MESQLADLKKMTRRPLQALTDNVKDEPFKSIKGQQNAINAIGYNFCWKSVKKYINEAGFFSRIPATRPTLMARHVEKRLAWAKERVDWPLEKWMTVVFSDESRFTVEGNDGGEHVLRPVGARYHPKYVHQKTKFGGGSVMVWACFWGGGFGPLVVVDGNMDQVKYVNTLSEHFLPWFQKLQEQHDDKLIFQEDGATCHTASYTQWWKKR